MGVRSFSKIANLQGLIKSLNQKTFLTRKVPLLLIVAQERSYWRPKKKRTPYTKELDFSYAGDESDHVLKVDLDTLRPGFEKFLEKYEKDGLLKKIFSMEYGNHCEMTEHIIDEVVKMVQDHPLDVKSIEVAVARDTVLIRNQMKHCVRYRHDNYSITILRNRITRRNDALGELLVKDKEKFDWLVEKLGIKYTSPDDVPPFVSKREKRLRRAEEASRALVEQKNQELQKKLQTERKRFEEIKAKELEAIEGKLKNMGIQMNNLPDVLTALGHQEMIPQKEKIPSKGKLIFEKKMAAFMPLKQIADDKKLKENDFLTPSEMPDVPDRLFY